MAMTAQRTWHSVLTNLAAVIAAATFLIIPAGYFAVEYHYERAAIQLDASYVGQIVTEAINTDQDYWQFQQHLLDWAVENRRPDYPLERRIIRNIKGEVLADTPGRLEWPVVRWVEPLFRGGQPVGELELVRSMRGMLWNTFLAALAGLFFSAGAFFLVRTLPLRALNQVFIQLKQEKERAEVTLQSIGDAVITTDASNRVQYLNPIAEELTGWRTSEVAGWPLAEVFCIIDESTRQPVPNPVEIALTENRIVEMTDHTVLLRRDGCEFHIEDSAAPIRGSDGKPIGAVIVFHDVTARKAAQKHLDHLAHHDTLTGLPNRALFTRRLEQALASSRRRQLPVALMFIDLDRFKTINDSLGHMTGDMLLLTVADRLFNSVRTEDTVARLGGDEFTIILDGVHHAETAATVAQNVLKVLETPFSIMGHELYISGSIGIAMSSPDTDPETLIKNADTAMYRAKEVGRGNYQFYDDAMNQTVVERLRMENALRQALKRSEFYLEYQPKLNLRSNRIESVEALIRWSHPELGRIAPGAFIPILEETALIVDVGNWVIQEACRQMREWRNEGLDLKVAVNVSGKQLKSKNFPEVVKAILDEHGLSGADLEVEITESVFLSSIDNAGPVLIRLEEMGLSISLDDFGTGYSGLGYLRKLPIRKLKIDKSFIDDLAQDKNNQALVEALIVMAHALSITVVAEGVETAFQGEVLQRLNCDTLQGYWINRPLAPANLATWLRHFSPPFAVVDDAA